MLTTALLIVAIGLAYANGANDNIKAFATLYGSGACTYRQAVTYATTAQLFGSLLSVVLAERLLQTFSGKGIVPDLWVASPTFLLAIGLAGAATVLLATLLGLPVSTTHALTGGIVGAGWALAPDALAWPVLGTKVLLPLLLTPLLALGATVLLHPVVARAGTWLRGQLRPCICLEPAPHPIRLITASARTVPAALEQPPPRLIVGAQQTCDAHGWRSLFDVDLERGLHGLHHLSAVVLGAARALNDTPKVLAIALVAGATGLETRWALLSISGAMAVGGLLHAKRLARRLGMDITPMTRNQGTLANLVASILVVGATLLGSPVSTTHVSAGALFGIGTARGDARWHTIGLIFVAWAVTLPAGALVAYAITRLV